MATGTSLAAHVLDLERHFGRDVLVVVEVGLGRGRRRFERITRPEAVLEADGLVGRGVRTGRQPWREAFRNECVQGSLTDATPDSLSVQSPSVREVSVGRVPMPLGSLLGEWDGDQAVLRCVDEETGVEDRRHFSTVRHRELEANRLHATGTVDDGRASSAMLGVTTSSGAVSAVAVS